MIRSQDSRHKDATDDDRDCPDQPRPAIAAVGSEPPHPPSPGGKSVDAASSVCASKPATRSLSTVHLGTATSGGHADQRAAGFAWLPSSPPRRPRRAQGTTRGRPRWRRTRACFSAEERACPHTTYVRELASQTTKAVDARTGRGSSPSPRSPRVAVAPARRQQRGRPVLADGASVPPVIAEVEHVLEQVARSQLTWTLSCSWSSHAAAGP
jgi:hypothetical protein